VKEFIYINAINRNKGSNNVAKTLRIFTKERILFTSLLAHKILDASKDYYTITFIEQERLNTTYCFAADRAFLAKSPYNNSHT
jgi:hypothetical protein